MSCVIGEVTEGLENELCAFILQPFCTFTYITAHSPTLLLLYLRHSSCSNPSFASLTLQVLHLIHLASCRAHSPTFLSLHLHHNSFSNPSVALPSSQLILQPFHCFTYITVHSPTLPLFLLRHKFCWRAAEFILQPFCHFTYVTTVALTYITAHSATLPLLHLNHSSFSNPSFAFPMSQALHLIHLVSRP